MSILKSEAALDEEVKLSIITDNVRRTKKVEEVHQKECPHCGGQVLVFIDRVPLALEPMPVD